MPEPDNNKPTPNRQIAFTGVRRDVAPHLLRQGEVRDALNVEFRAGTIKKRKGFTIVSRTDLNGATPRALGCFSFPPHVRWNFVAWPTSNSVAFERV